MELKLKVIGREVIKPASSSPHGHLQLSILDLSCSAIYVSTIFFYKSEDLVAVTSEKLKNSLSETLSLFYPLAGQLEGVSIICNNKGAVFTEARTDLLLPDFLKNLNTDSLEELRPTISPGDSPTKWPLLSIKVTFFGDGSGVAISVCVSHRICDASSLLTFVTDWATTTAKKKSNVSNLQFAETNIYPPPPPHMASQPPSPDSNATLTKKCVMNRFVFEACKIVDLKHKAASENVLKPTRVEAITSFIWKCARNASRSNLVVPRPTLMYQAVDLRLRIPSNVLSRDAIGNLQTAFFLKKDTESELEIGETVAAFRKAKEEVNEEIQENLQGDTLGQGLMNVMGKFVSEFKPDIDIYTMSSWCGKPFYEVDFGWGSPVWMGSASHTIYDDNMVYVVLMDSKDCEGVEAWISLPKQDMSVFVCDQELLAYAVLNPPVLV